MATGLFKEILLSSCDAYVDVQTRQSFSGLCKKNYKGLAKASHGVRETGSLAVVWSTDYCLEAKMLGTQM